VLEIRKLHSALPGGRAPATALDRRCCSRSRRDRASLLINAFGSVRRMALALEVNELDEVAERIRDFLKMETPQFLRQGEDAAKARGTRIVFPERREERPCKEVNSEGN